jgi:NAD(P)H-dependent FMN reductase
MAEVKMKLVILNGSPRIKGCTAHLLESFERGLARAGHSWKRFDLARMDLHPCKACYYCEEHNGRCVQADAMPQILEALLQADGIVFATPLYYFGMSAQIKTCIDRFYSIDAVLRTKAMKAILISPAADEHPIVAEGLLTHYRKLCHYLNLEDVGQLLALGISEPEDLAASPYMDRAETLGANLR